MTSYRTLARNHDFTVLWIGETISTLGSRMSMLAFPLVAYAISGSTLTAAWTEAAHLVGLSATLLPAGVVVDRFDRRRLMVLASGSGVLLYGSLAVAGILGSLTIAHLVLVALLTGAGAGVFGPAQTSAIRSVVPREDLPTALSQNQAREHVAGLLGAPIGGALYALARWLPFAVDAVSFAVSCFTLSRIRTDLAPTRRGARSRLRTDLVEGLRFVAQRPFFRVMLSWAALANLVTNAIFFVALLRMIQDGHGPARIGLTETAAGLGGILGAVVAPFLIDRLATGRLTVLVAWALVPPTIPLIWWSTPLAVGVSLFVLMLLNPAGNAGIGAYRIAVTPADLQGRVAATSQFLAMSVMPLSPVLGGLLLETYGGAVAIAALTAASAGLAVLLTVSRSVRTVPHPRHWSATNELATAA
ncbi:MAG TPA: MFS transporter [Nocardioides sp.]|uniref:MFS transporter n=1 Tax=Nocardioides sp. TaxID=35761 RepID=UPI002BBAFC2F|nr:MFS transporter [Nocardioides sp.]HQR25867.1 MFS transporter [Nocardioides sp.]